MQHLKKILPAALALAASPISPPSTPKWRPALDAYEDSLVKASELAAQFVADIAGNGFPRRWLTLIGVCGNGKTMLARQVFEEARKHNPHRNGVWIHPGQEASDWTRRPGSVWMTANEFADGIRKEFKLPELLAQDYLVVIDDVGAARDTTTFIADGLYRLANVRLGKWTMFTSNLGLSDIAKQVDERFASRLLRDGNVVHRINAGDYALRKRA